jgi:hypothetical protein
MRPHLNHWIPACYLELLAVPSIPVDSIPSSIFCNVVSVIKLSLCFSLCLPGKGFVSFSILKDFFFDMIFLVYSYLFSGLEKYTSSPSLQGFYSEIYWYVVGFAFVSNLMYLSFTFQCFFLCLYSWNFYYSMTWKGAFLVMSVWCSKYLRPRPFPKFEKIYSSISLQFFSFCLFYFSFYHFYIYLHVYKLFMPPPPSPSPLSFWAEPVLPSHSSVLLKKKHRR